MEALRYLVPLGVGALLFGFLLLCVPVVQVARQLRSLPSVTGLCIAGWGFFLIGIGLVFAGRGWGVTVLPGIVATVVGHFVQSRYNRRARP